MPNRGRGRPKGPARKHGPQTIYAAYRALQEHLPEASTTAITQMVGKALYVPPTAHPHTMWVEVEFAFGSGAGPFRIQLLASGEGMVRATMEQESGPLVLWRSKLCSPPDLPKQETIGNSAAAIATQLRRLLKALGEA